MADTTLTRQKEKERAEKEKEEEEGERLANFFYTLHYFFIPAAVPGNVFVPAELPARYAIDFVPTSIVFVARTEPCEL